MPRPALTEEQRQQIRRNIRQAAADLYAENGMANISARQIAQAAGVSVGTLYGYFSNLTELMQSLWKQPVSRLIRDFEAQLAAIEDPYQRLRTFMTSYVEFATGQRQLYRGAFMYVRPESHDKPTPVPLKDDRFFALLHGAVSDAQAQGLIRSGDTQALAQTIWAGLHGAISLPLNLDRLALDPPEVAASRMIDTLLEWLQP